MDKNETIHRQDNNGRTYQSNNTYKLSHSNEQSLINTMFGVAMRVYDSKGIGAISHLYTQKLRA